jgi:glucosylceramidase
MSNKSGYTEIVQGRMDSYSSEDTPFIPSSPPQANGDNTDNSKKYGIGLLAVGALFGILVVVVSTAVGRDSSSSTRPVRTPEADSTVSFRPVCEYYDTGNTGTSSTAKSVRRIQTSMQEPSQQWSPQPCYQADSGTTSSGFWPFQKTTVSPAKLNAYKMPDAILKVNFSSAPFSDRDTAILGFGGAFTEAAALNYNSLPEKAKDAAMELLFGETGLGYSLGRVHINSCDFSVESYSFDDVDGDFKLHAFDTGVNHDVRSGMVDMALRATAVFRQGWGNEKGDGNLLMYASPWSPPAWMKSPTWEDDENATHAAKMTYSAQPSCLREGVGPDSRYAAAWALYFSKFLTAYEDLGLPLWAVTVQNEPEFPAPWEACSYTPQTQQDFVANHLGPILRRDHPDTKIFVFDHNKDHVNTWVDTLLNHTSAAAEYISGTAYHWYAGGMQRLLDGAVGSANMHRLQSNLEKYGVKKDHLVLGTESCHCPTTGYSGGQLDTLFQRGERYAHTILADLAAGSNGWVEWNLILDSIGGPNHLGNLCESTILAVPHRARDAARDAPPLPYFETTHALGNGSLGDGRTREELNALGIPAKYLDIGLAVQPIYFYMGHISRYVRPGSVAVMGLVDSSPGPGRMFRPEGQSVPGGGLNNLALEGIELNVWPCEGSTRQQFDYNKDYKNHIQVYGHDWLGNPTESCIGRSVDKDLLGLRLTKCDWQAGVFEVISLAAVDAGLFNILLRNNPHSSDKCVVIKELKNGGGAYGPRGGAQVALGDCLHQSAKWKLDLDTGEASSTYFADENGENEVCLTTGWPFLQMGAFLTPNGEASKTIVILNEASDSANFALKDENDILLTGSIPPRSIQTVLLD